MEMIQAGFKPTQLKQLCEKIRSIAKLTIKSTVKKFRIALPDSKGSEAFAIPGPSYATTSVTPAYLLSDPLGILEEGHIYYRSSNGIKDNKTQTLFHVLTGPVIVSYDPAFQFVYVSVVHRLEGDVARV